MTPTITRIGRKTKNRLLRSRSRGPQTTLVGGDEMNSRTRRFVEFVLNGAIIAGCLALISGTVYSYIGRPKRGSAGPETIGRYLNIPDIAWHDSKHTIVLALSTHCHYCTASASFYKHLQAVAEGKGVPIVAVLPQPSGEARAYLADLHISIDLVRQLPLSGMNVSATPTLMIVNSEGKVTDSWVGQLTPSLESEVLAKL